MKSRSLRSLTTIALNCALLALAACAAWCAPPKLPESGEGQAIIWKVEEIFHTHPERAEECVRLLNEVLEKYPGTRQASLALAYLSYGHQAALKEMDMAEQYQARLEKEFPDSLALGELLILRGEAYEKEANVQKARECYERSIQVLDKYLPERDARLMRRDATHYLAFLLERQFNDPAAAVKVILDADKVLTGTPEQESIWRYMGEISRRHGGVSGVPSFEDLSGGNLPDLPAESRAAAMLGAAYGQITGQPEYAEAARTLATLEQSYATTHHGVGILLLKGKLLRRTQPGDPAAWLSVFEKVKDQFSNDPRAIDAYGERARYFQVAGNFEQAMAERRAAAANENLYPAARAGELSYMGERYRKMGRTKEAVEAYQEARQVGAGYEPAWTAVSRLEELGVNPWPTK